MAEKLLAVLMLQGYKVFMRPFELNIIGVRSNDRTPNIFNDTINIVYHNGKAWQIHSFPATTDPGLYWLKQPMNVNGTAILKTGQYLNSHIIGLHRKQYTALVQRQPVTVVRDPTRDASLDFDGVTETGLFGINIHRAKQQGTANSVDKFSAGCQVFASTTDFNAFMTMCEKHSGLYGNSFTYTLINEPVLAGQQAA